MFHLSLSKRLDKTLNNLSHLNFFLPLSRKELQRLWDILHYMETKTLPSIFSPFIWLIKLLSWETRDKMDTCFLCRNRATFCPFHLFEKLRIVHQGFKSHSLPLWLPKLEVVISCISQAMFIPPRDCDQSDLAKMFHNLFLYPAFPPSSFMTITHTVGPASCAAVLKGLWLLSSFSVSSFLYHDKTSISFQPCRLLDMNHKLTSQIIISQINVPYRVVMNWDNSM